MTRAERSGAGGLGAWVAVGGVAALTVLLRGRLLAPLPEMIRLAAAFAGVVLLPGAAFVALGARPPGGARFAFPWAMGFGVAWNSALILITQALHVRFTVLLDLAPLPMLLPWLMVAVRAARARSATSRPAASAGPVRGAAWALVLGAVVLAMLHAGRIGAPMEYSSDSPDHIGTIRRMLASGDAFPNDAFFRDAGRAGADPRKGLWHPQLAMVAQLARVDPADAWRQLPAVIAPIFVFNAAQLGWLSRAGAGAAVFAWAQLILLAGSFAWFPLRKGVYSTFLADQLALATAIAVLADVDRPSRSGRLAAVGLALGAVACHVYSAIQFAMVLGALTVALAIRERTFRGAAARVAGTAAWLGAACLPYLLWRARQSYAPVNIIHTDPQGLMWLTDSWRVVAPYVLWDWMGWLWVLFPLAAWWLWKDGRRDPAALYTLSTTLAVALVIFDPPVVGLLSPRLGYLMMRMIWMVPLAPLVGWSAMALVRAVRAGPGRLRPAVALAALLLLLLPTARNAAATLIDPKRFAHATFEQSPLRWREAMAWLDTHLPAGQVVLSDPATSYGVPMLTRDYVETLVDQHSSPADSLALTRILDARDALDPYASWQRTREVVRRWGVTVVVINSDFPDIPLLDYWSVTPQWAAGARARLDAVPAAFEKVYDRRGFTIYRVLAGLDTLNAPAPARPFVVPFVSGRFPIGRRIGEGLPAILRLSLWPARVAVGDSLGAVAEWRALAPLAAGSYRVAVRFEQPLPGGFAPPAAIAKPVRKVFERMNHRRWRFRDDHLPVGGAFGVDLWRPGFVVRDSFEVGVPFDAAPGYYRVEIRMNRSPHYPNFLVSDYFSDRDYYSGVAMGWIEVVPDRAALSRPPAPPPAGSFQSH